MSEPTRPITPEFEKLMASEIEYLVSRDLGQGDKRRHNLELLRDVCRAAQNGRLPVSLHKHYQGILRHLRPQIAAAIRAGDRIPYVVVKGIEDIAPKRMHK